MKIGSPEFNSKYEINKPEDLSDLIAVMAFVKTKPYVMASIHKSKSEFIWLPIVRGGEWT